MIPQRAITEFLDRPLRDSAKVKSFSSQAIEHKLLAAGVSKAIWEPMFEHQRKTFLLGLLRQRYLLLLEQGLGKSLVSIGLYQQANKVKPIRGLVLVPGSANVGQWEDEVKKHAPHLSVSVIDGKGREERMEQVLADRNLTAITYMGFLSLCCSGKLKANEKGEIELDAEGNPKTKGWEIDDEKLQVFVDRYKFLVADEVTACRSIHSMHYKAVKKVSWAAEWSFGLTGTPFGVDPQALWAIFNVIDRGESLGPTLGLLRAAFFTEVINHFGGREHNLRADMKDEFRRMLRHSSIRYEKTECADLPEKIPVVRPVIFPDEAWKYYDALIVKLNADHAALRVNKSPWHQLRCISSGYLPVKTEREEKTLIRFKENPKLDAVLECLEEIGDSKAIIFYEYKISGDILCEGLKKAKINHVRIAGGVTNKPELVRQFISDPRIRVLASSSAGAFGGNWQIANYVLFFETPSDPILRSQMEARSHRLGTTKTVFVYDFPVRGSVDDNILDALKENKNLFDELIDGKITLERNNK